MPDPLDPRSILSSIHPLLPRSTSSPLPKTTDVIAALVHAIHAALGFRLVNQPTSDPETFTQVEAETDDTASETETAVNEEDEPTTSENTLNQSWNERGEDNYSFEYRHAQSSLAFRVRVGRMGGRVQIDATAEDGAPNSISVVLTDLVNPSAFPIPSSATASGSSTSSSESPAKNIGFKSVDAVKGFIEQYKRDIIAKLIPGLQVEGYTESISDPRNPPPRRPSVDPSPAGPAQDPLLDTSHRGSYGRMPNPASVGHNDLDPQGIHPNFGGGGPGGGMYMDFNHPLFDGRRRGNPDLQGGPGGTIQPPGARWDPVGPGYGSEFPRAGGNPLGGMGVGDRNFGDELPPPGEFGPDVGGLGGLGGPRRPGGPGGPGSLGGGMGPGGFGGLGGGGRFGGGGGGGGGGFGGGGMYM